MPTSEGKMTAEEQDAVLAHLRQAEPSGIAPWQLASLMGAVGNKIVLGRVGVMLINQLRDSGHEVFNVSKLSRKYRLGSNPWVEALRKQGAKDIGIVTQHVPTGRKKK